MSARRGAKAAEKEHLGAGLLDDAGREGIVRHKRPDEAGTGQEDAESGGGSRRHGDGEGSSCQASDAHSPAEIRQAFSTSRSIVASWKIGNVSCPGRM